MTNNISLDKDNLLGRLDRQLDWIKSCDTKASIVIAVLGVFLTIFTTDSSITLVKSILSQAIQFMNFANLLYLIFFVFSWIMFVYGAYCLVKVLIPRLSKEVQTEQGIYSDSLYFFETIAKDSFIDFKNKMISGGPEDEINDILTQIYINAKISTIKYSYYSKGIKCSFLGIVSILIFYVIGIILLKVGGFY